MLKYSFNQLASKNEQITPIDEDVTFANDFFVRAKDLLITVNSAHVAGNLVYDKPFVFAQLEVKAEVVAPSSRSLKEVKLPLNFKFMESYTKETPTEEDFETLGTIMELTEDEIDLQTAVEDNILLNLPIQILTEEEAQNDEMPSGQDWQVISETAYQEMQKDKKKDTANSPFAKLEGLFDEDDKQD